MPQNRPQTAPVFNNYRKKSAAVLLPFCVRSAAVLNPLQMLNAKAPCSLPSIPRSKSSIGAAASHNPLAQKEGLFMLEEAACPPAAGPRKASRLASCHLLEQCAMRCLSAVFEIVNIGICKKYFTFNF